MAWTVPATRTTGTLITAALWNAAVIDNIRFLGVTHNHSGDAGDGATLTLVPSGLIAMFDAACPSGWTRVSAWDSKMIRGASSYGGTGGSDAHTHTGPSHTHSVAAHGHTASSHTHAGPSHTHAQNSSGAFSTGAGSFIYAQNKLGAEMDAVYPAGSWSLHYNMLTGASAGGTGETGNHTADVTDAAAGTSGSGVGTTGSTSLLPAYVGVVFCKKN
jgi:hypothetical protein